MKLLLKIALGFLALVVIIVIAAQENEEGVQSALVSSDGTTVAPVSLRDRVAEVIYEKLDEKQFRGVSIEGDQLWVDFNVAENLSASMTRRGAFSDAKDIIEIVSTEAGFDSISVYHITGYFPLQDQYGNAKEEIVAQIELTRDVAKKVNWDNMFAENFENLVRAEGKLFLHAAFQR